MSTRRNDAQAHLGMMTIICPSMRMSEVKYIRNFYHGIDYEERHIRFED